MAEQSHHLSNSLGRNQHSDQKLKTHQIEMINQAIETIGDYGEVRLIVERGRLRFLVTQKSVDLLKPPSERIEFK